jgi:Zn-dependent protease
MFNFDFQALLLSLPAIIIALSFHEFAHAYASDKLGDPTPRNMGRLTLSPFAHLDPIGFIMLLLVHFGWAKPVPVNPRYYKNPRRDDFIVSAAGPLMNLFLAVVFTLILKLLIISNVNSLGNDLIISNLFTAIIDAIIINISLFIFNLIPIPPLDGFHVLKNLISYRYYHILAKLEQYGFILLILFLLASSRYNLISKPVSIIYTQLLTIFNIR